ncbi:MAG TPA: hypothetical protein VGI32_12115 [Steroidobacteraceae bacterium]|jgi:hypothetical protein
MRRKALRQVSVALQLALAGSTGALAQSAAQSFSADIVALDSSGAPRGATAKLHAANHKSRIEVPDASDGFFISDVDIGTALFVRSAQRIYLDARQSTPLTQIFVWVDPRDPCRQWQAAAVIAGMAGTDAWHCEPIERATVSQHEVIEYRVSMPDRQPSYGWVDSTLGFPVKWRAPDGKMFVVENILLQAQPASLFSIPPGYRKLDPQALLERIKHSDVWVDSAK